jgi:pimeloyl-ACP methyl ester carboxylesterase
MSGHEATGFVAAWHLSRGSPTPAVSESFTSSGRKILEAGTRLLATADVEARGFFHDHPDGRTHYTEVVGKAELEPLVLLHGGAGGGANWFAVLDAYARRRRVLAPDMPGFGLSSAIPHGRSLGRRAARRLASWLRGIGVRRFALAGTSFGGLVAAHLAARRDLRVTRLVLIDSAGLGRAVHPFLRLASTALLRPAVGLSSKAGARAIFRGLMVHDPGAMPRRQREALVDYLYVCGQAGVDRLVADALPHFVSWTGQRERADLFVLPEARCPVLAVCGEHDAIFPARHVRRLPGRVDAAGARVIPGVGHSPMWEGPQALVEATRTFLEAASDAPEATSDLRAATSELLAATSEPPAATSVFPAATRAAGDPMSRSPDRAGGTSPPTDAGREAIEPRLIDPPAAR